jgi:UDP:flavonoid glycosyltransferase YjiC (YdhE family)
VVVLPTPCPDNGNYPAHDVETLEDVAAALGVADPGYLKASIRAECNAIRSRRLQAVFHDYQLTLPVSASACGIPSVSTVSWADHTAFCSPPQVRPGLRLTPCADAINVAAASLDLPEVADLGTVLFELGTPVAPTYPIMDPNVGAVPGVEYVGHLAWRGIEEVESRRWDAWPRHGRSGVIAYTSGGDFTVHDYLDVLSDPACDRFDVVIAGFPKGHKASRTAHVTCATTVPLRKLLHRASAFMSHGGRNSLANAVQAGTPMLIYPGSDPERGYFARNVEAAGIAVVGTSAEFDPAAIADQLGTLTADCVRRELCQREASDAQKYGGAGRVVEILQAVAR